MGRSLPFGRANPRFLASSLILKPKRRGLRGAEPPATQRKRHNAWSRRLLVGGCALLSSQTPPFWLLHFPLSQNGGVCEAHGGGGGKWSAVRPFRKGRSATAGHAAVVVDARRRCGARERTVGSQVLACGRSGARGRHGWRASVAARGVAMVGARGCRGWRLLNNAQLRALFSRKFPWLVKIFLDSGFTP